MESRGEPAAIVLVQSRPGQIRRGDVEKLHTAAPLSRLVALVGEWCDGELRSGRPWPGVVRVPLNSWRCRLAQELGLEECKGRSLMPLPRTVTAAEHLESTLMTLQPGNRVRTAAVFSRSRATYEAIADLLQRLAINSIWQNETAASGIAADVLVCDGWEEVPTNGRLHLILPRLLLLHFPRGEDHVRAAREGIAAVLAWPLLITDLATTLDRILPAPSGHRNATEGVPYSASKALR